MFTTVPPWNSGRDHFHLWHIRNQHHWNMFTRSHLLGNYAACSLNTHTHTHTHTHAHTYANSFKAELKLLWPLTFLLPQLVNYEILRFNSFIQKPRINITGGQRQNLRDHTHSGAHAWLEIFQNVFIQMAVKLYFVWVWFNFQLPPLYHEEMLDLLCIYCIFRH